MARPKKIISKKEKEFAKLIANGLKPVEAARKAFKWKCEPNSAQNMKAKDLAREPRIEKEVKRIQDEELKKAVVEGLVSNNQPADWDSLHKYAFERLETIRDNEDQPANTRFEAIKALEKLTDPAQDVNLIQRYVNTVWDGFTAHCPCCHEDFPLWKVENEQLDEYRLENGYPPHARQESFFERRIHLLKQAEKRKYPHKTQIKALAAPERHIVGKGSARGGKSFLLGMFGYMFLMIPGVEVWVLARVYDDAESEVEYLDNFLKTVFHPVDKHMYSFTQDKKTGEAQIETKWGSVIKIKSGKSKGSITGRELEAILVAEPAWVDGELFEEVRARMSSRLGRILALGTPKGFGGFLGRLIRMTNRDMRTGRKLADGERLIENNCPWGQSILQYHIPPEDNPEYVLSEIEAAKSELTHSEYAAEFEGRMVSDTNNKFPWFSEDHLIQIKREWMQSCVFVLGIDQGERNFGACLLGWDGHRIFVVDEYFDDTDTTIKANMIKVNQMTSPLISLIGGDPEQWQLTIFDADPPITNILYELEDECREWKTEITERPKNMKEFMNWREETCLWANEVAKEGNLIFSVDRCDLLHEQLRDALIRPIPEGTEARNANRKGWIINDPWRGEHVPDAWLLAMWTLYNHMLTMPAVSQTPGDAFEEARRAMEYQRMKGEQHELRGFRSRQPIDTNPDDVFEHIMGRRPAKRTFGSGIPGWYRDES
jgi:hypothetical protein